MKKKMKTLTASLAIAAAVVLAIPAGASANEAGLTVKVNGQVIQSANNYFSAEGKSYVDVDAFSKVTGISYTLSEDGKQATINGNTFDVESVNGAPVAYVRALAEAAGVADVVWDGQTNTVQLVYDANLAVYGDTVSHLGGCVVQNRFAVGDSVVFRMRAVNSVSGQVEKGAALQVHLSTGDVLDMHLDNHSPDEANPELFWTAVYNVTDETPKGTLNYYVTAESGALKGEYKPFNVMPSLITIVAAEPSTTPAPDANAGAADAAE